MLAIELASDTKLPRDELRSIWRMSLGSTAGVELAVGGTLFAVFCVGGISFIESLEDSEILCTLLSLVKEQVLSGGAVPGTTIESEELF